MLAKSVKVKGKRDGLLNCRGLLFPLTFSLCCFLFSSCAAVRVPGAYIKDHHPYRERFYGDFDKVMAAVQAALDGQGWVVDKAVDPAVYERWQDGDLYERQILLITEGREHSGLLGDEMARLNVYIRNRRDISEVELRYVAVTHYRLKGVTRYQDDGAAKAFFDRLRQDLPAAASTP